MKLMVDLNVPLDDLWHVANKRGYLRDDPTKVWSENEKKRAVKWLLEKLAAEAVSK